MRHATFNNELLIYTPTPVMIVGLFLSQEGLSAMDSVSPLNHTGIQAYLYWAASCPWGSIPPRKAIHHTL
jgi:hypothetical protein